MIEREFVVKNKLGLHIRPATELVRRVSKFKSKIQFIKEDEVADAKSLIDLMMLTLLDGDKVKVVVDGEDEDDLMKIVEDFFEHNCEYQLNNTQK